MEVKWYSLTPKLLEGVALSNVIPSTKFSLLLAHLFKAAKHQNDKPFGDEELKNLRTSLKLNENDLKLMLTSLAYIVKRSNLFIIKPTDMQEDLINIFKFDQTKAETLVKLWTEYTKIDIDNLEQRQILQKLSWELNLEVASDSNFKKAVPCSILQFCVKDSNEKMENITLDMSEEQLLELYNQVENMQFVLDSLK